MKQISHNKVLIPLYYYHPYVSGVSVCAKRVAEGLVKAGYEVTVLTSRYEKKLKKEEYIEGVRVLRRPVLLHLNKGVIMPTFWLDIIRYGRLHDYIQPNLPLAESGLSAIFLPKRKFITVYQCDLNLGKGLIEKTLVKFSMLLMKLQLHRSRVVVPSSMDYLESSRMKAFAAKAVAIDPMVTVQEFNYIKPDNLYKKIGVGKDEVKIGFVGRIVYEKGISYLLDSIGYLEKKLSNFKVVIVGDYEKVAGGSVKEQLDSYIERFPGRIIFTGFLNDKERNQFYSGLDVLVLPSVDPLEAYGMVQIEAMLCGAPVVASDLPGVRTIVGRTGYGRISKIRNSKDIAKQIIEVVQRKQKYKPDRGRVVELFDPKQTIATYERLMPK